MSKGSKKLFYFIFPFPPSDARAIMSELLTVISIEPIYANCKNPSPAPPLASNPPDIVSDQLSQVPLDAEDRGLKQGRIIIIITVLTGVNFLASLCNGFITIGLPRIASDLSLPDGLLIWPSAVYLYVSSFHATISCRPKYKQLDKQFLPSGRRLCRGSNWQ